MKFEPAPLEDWMRLYYFAVDDGTYAFASCGLPECRAALDARDLDAFRGAWSRAYGQSIDGLPLPFFQKPTSSSWAAS